MTRSPSAWKYPGVTILNPVPTISSGFSSQCDREHREEGESRIPLEDPDAVAKVLQDCFERGLHGQLLSLSPSLCRSTGV
jgi:hypothetical protein